MLGWRGGKNKTKFSFNGGSYDIIKNYTDLLMNILLNDIKKMNSKVYQNVYLY